MNFSQIRVNYSKRRPPAFTNDMKYNWNQKAEDINSCAVRLADAISRADAEFFRGDPAAEWTEPLKTGGRRLPVKAARLAESLEAKLGRPQLLPRGRSGIEFIKARTGIIYFDGIHISLWDGPGGGVVDGLDFWDDTQTYFWDVP